MSSDTASTYSTGGGGVTLEHQYAATLLAALLVGDPVTELGDTLELTTVRFQASDISAVDDLVLEGHGADGVVHRASIAVRREVRLIPSELRSVPLVRSYLDVVSRHWDEVAAGRWSLTLAVARHRPAIDQIGDLAALARGVSSAADFAELTVRPASMNAPTRQRMTALSELVRTACDGSPELERLGVAELVWRWLSVLKVRVLRLESADTTDRTTAVSALRNAMGDDSAATADAVFSRLSELSGGYASRGSRVTEGMLRRELSGHPIDRQRNHASAWRVFDRLRAQLIAETRSTIAAEAGTSAIRIERTDATASLREVMERIARGTGAVVVVGEPDVGKSALTVKTFEEMSASGTVAVALNLRDVPGSTLEFETSLGRTSLEELFAGAGTSESRMLVLDGCEAVLEGKQQVFEALVHAAAAAGFGVVGVTRLDGSRRVRESMQACRDRLTDLSAVEEHRVESLSESERTDLARAVPPLARLHADFRANWLLGRPGLVDAVLRSGARLEPGQLLCEADVYVAVWNGLVRRDEIFPPGATSPDDRAHALVAVARRRLGLGGTPNGNALRELRSDGLLRTESNPALTVGPDFSTDLYRDFALCRFFLESGWKDLRTVGMPRWPIRAARLTCQARLIAAERQELEAQWAQIVREFDELAEIDGARWRELPLEALLTLGDGGAALSQLWSQLSDGNGLAGLLRLAESRFVRGGVGDPYALAPIVKVAFCDNNLSASHHHRGSARSPRELVMEIVLAWLRGLAMQRRDPDQLRQRVRDLVLSRDPELYNSFAVEALASLGPDTDDRVEAWLRRVAAERPSSLYEAVESPMTVISLANHQPDLLVDLSEAYYIERDDENGWGGWGRGHLDDGIRDSRHGGDFGVGPPHAAWYFGPFFRILQASPLRALGFINRMLNHAAAYRVADGPVSSLEAGSAGWCGLEGLTLDLSSRTGARHYVGDSATWGWYRGTTAGPHACMSALLALEKFADYLYEEAGLSTEVIANLLLESCHNLAVPGMLAGFLIRHPDSDRAMLDEFLSSVDVWQLEMARSTAELSLRFRDSDADELTGGERRRFTPHDVVGSELFGAHERGDQQRLDELESVGERLIESARAKVASHESASSESSDGSAVFIATVKSWAAEFSLSNYQAREVDEGVLVEFDRPVDVAKALQQTTDRLAVGNLLYALQGRYAVHNETPERWPTESLAEDIQAARSLGDSVHDAAFLRPEDPLTAVAAAAIRAHVTSARDVAAADLLWASDRVLHAAENPYVDGMSSSGAFYSMAADRAAAVAVPLLLSPRCDDLDLESERIDQALVALSTSLFDEVRMAFALGCSLIWSSECLIENGVCRRHKPVWAAVEQSLVDCVLGRWDSEHQSRERGVLGMPASATLPKIEAHKFLINRLRMPVVSVAGASAASCIQEDVSALVEPLWDAHRRGLLHWWSEGYDHLDHRRHLPVARVLIEAAIQGDRDQLDSHLRTLASNAHATQLFMDSLASLFTYDSQLRRHLGRIWPPSTAVVLDELETNSDQWDDAGTWFEYAVASLLPTPSIESGDLDPDATLAQCSASWMDPVDFEDLFRRWARIARGTSRAADAVARLARTAPISWQATVGLEWLETIIGDSPEELSNRVWFATHWLEELRSRRDLEGDSISRFRRVVDGLAAGGDSAAVGLQRLEE